MELSDAIRYYIEENGIEKVPDVKFYWWISDLSKTESQQYKYILRSSGFQNLFKKLLDTAGDEKCIVQLSYKFAKETGFQQDLVKNIISDLSLGIRKAFWGRYPEDNKNLLLRLEYLENKTAWQKQVKAFEKGTYLVQVDGYYTWINKNGNQLIPHKIYGCTNFSEGYSCIRNFFIFGFINIRGNLELDLNHYLPKNYNGISPSVGPLKNGISVYKYEKDKMGFINVLGNKTDAIFDDYKAVDSNLTPVKINELWGFLDSNCNLIIDIKYNLFHYLEKKRFLVSNNEGWYIIFENGKEIKLKLSKAIDWKWFYNKEEEIIIFYRFNRLLNSFNYHIFNIDGNRINTFSSQIFDLKNYPFISYKSNGFGFITKRKNCENIQFDYLFPFQDHYSWAKKGFYWLLIDEEGEVIKNTDKFDILSKYFKKGSLARNRMNGNICIINNKLKNIRELPNTSYISPKNEKYKFSVDENNYYFEKGNIFKIETKDYIIYPIIGIDNNNEIRTIMVWKTNNSIVYWDYLKQSSPIIINNRNFCFVTAFINKIGYFIIFKDDNKESDTYQKFYFYNIEKRILSNAFLTYDYQFINSIIVSKEKDKNFIINSEFIKISDYFMNYKKVDNDKIIISKDIIKDGNKNNVKAILELKNTIKFIIPWKYSYIRLQKKSGIIRTSLYFLT